MFKKYSFPDKYQEKIENALQSLGFSLKDPKPLAECILELSDFYQKKEKITPWSTKRTQAAYLAYFLPLNYIRNLKVFDEAKRLAFAPSHKSLLDFGFGLGSGYLAAKDSGVLNTKSKIYAVDSSEVPLSLFKKFFKEADEDIEFQTHFNPQKENIDLALFSYSLNELPDAAPWLKTVPHLIVLEPSTQVLGRQLMARREELIEQGFSIWAPCTHQQQCPLLHQSKHDWCHDRVHWSPPTWWQQIEALLPMKNQTMTLSYLMASQNPAPQSVTPTGFSKGRIVGDDLPEKGKTRWLFCQGPEREFLSWLKKSGETPDLHRGEYIELEILEKKGNELRFNKN